MSVSRAAQMLGVAWRPTSTAVLARAEKVLTEGPHRFGGVEILGVDDSPARFALKREVPPLYGATPGRATGTPAAVIDLTPVRDATGPARLLDVAPGRSKKVLEDLARRPPRVLEAAG